MSAVEIASVKEPRHMFGFSVKPIPDVRYW